MTLIEQILTQLFKSETPDCPRNIEAVYLMFSYLCTWGEFRELLVLNRFDMPTGLATLQKRETHKVQKNDSNEHPRDCTILFVEAPGTDWRVALLLPDHGPGPYESPNRRTG